MRKSGMPIIAVMPSRAASSPITPPMGAVRITRAHRLTRPLHLADHRLRHAQHHQPLARRLAQGLGLGERAAQECQVFLLGRHPVGGEEFRQDLAGAHRVQRASAAGLAAGLREAILQGDGCRVRRDGVRRTALAAGELRPEAGRSPAPVRPACAPGPGRRRRPARPSRPRVSPQRRGPRGLRLPCRPRPAPALPAGGVCPRGESPTCSRSYAWS